MRKINKIVTLSVGALAIAALGAVALAVFVFGTFFGTRMEYTSASRGEISELQEKGWLPTSLTPSAKDVHIVYDLDTNLGFGVCRQPIAENLNGIMRLRPVSTEEARQTFAITDAGLRKHPSWWPADMAQKIRNGDFRLAADRSHFFASKGEQLYFWLVKQGA